jgi:tetratricopeptide (TPR) repeat protein
MTPLLPTKRFFRPNYLISARIPDAITKEDVMKPVKLFIAASAFSLLCPAVALAHDEDEVKGKLGQVKFENSCDAKVQPLLQRGVAMLHSFWYSAAEKTFRDILAQDPGCAIATWGFASIMMSNPLAGQGASAKGAEQSLAMLEQGRKIGAKTQRERDYIEAVAAYYEDWGNRSERARQLARAKAYEALAARYPQDDEAQIFSALYIAGTQLQSDQTYAAYLKAAGILEKQFPKYPDHPGVAHYLIHSYDAPPIAQQGLNAARRYAGIAPEAPHALHMPSHIFTRVGAWEESAATNMRSAEAAKKGGEPNEAYHASDYAVYAYLQLGRDRDARRTMEDVFKVTDYTPGVRTAPYAIAAMPARIAMERGAWREAMQLQVQPTKLPFVDAITHSARAIGAARSGDAAAAEKDSVELARLHKALQESKDNYWATEVEIQRLAVSGWIALAQGNADNALKLMRAAADLEDKNEKSIVTPGRIVPARELLGDMLLELKQPALALKEYEASHQREPNRFRGFYGAALAAEAAGDRQKAAEYYGKLLALAKNSDGNRPEVARAKSFIAQR